MKRWLAFLLLLCGGLLQTAAWAQPHAPFYKAERNGQVVYVLGTLHVGRSDFYPLRPAIENAARQAARVYLEINLDEPGVEEKTARAMLCSPPCLKEALSESEWNTLAQRLDNQEMALRALEQMRPWAAAVVLALGDFAALGFSAELSVEKQVVALAGDPGKTVGLESVEEQMRLFTDMAPVEQKEMLVQWINMTPGERLDLNRQMVALWEQGNAEAMHDWYKKTEMRYSGNPTAAASFDRKFLVERNRVLAQRLLAQIGNAPGPFFLAVGALHLGGPDGVLALLKKQGFQVKVQ